jgi:hypothetical protein
MTGTTLARSPNGTVTGTPVASVNFSLDESMRLAEVLAASGFFSDARGMAQAVTKMLAGRELGVGPIASMTGVNIIKGKVTLSANIMASAIKRHPNYTFRVTEHTGQVCSIDFYEGGEVIGSSSFSMDDAKTAKLTSSDMYTKFPKNMLFSRALSNGAKWHTPDVFGGPVYTPDELGAEVGEDGEIIHPAEVLLPRKLPEPAGASTSTTATPVNYTSTPPPAEAPPRVLGALLTPDVPEVGLAPDDEDARDSQAAEDARPPVIKGDDNSKVSPVEAKEITDYLRAVGAGRQFVLYALIDCGVQKVSDPHEAVGRITKAQAKSFVAAIAAKCVT